VITIVDTFTIKIKLSNKNGGSIGNNEMDE
jgi:hypothetical protein